MLGELEAHAPAVVPERFEAVIQGVDDR